MPNDNRIDEDRAKIIEEDRARIIEEERAKIKELQRYLREIAIKDTRVPILAIDGFYLDDTANSVSKFQTINNLEPTGETDETTWNSVFNRYLEIKRRDAPPVPLNIFKNPDTTLYIGAQGYTIYFIQTILKILSQRFYNLGDLEITGVYDAQTELAIRKVREVTGVTEDEKIDKNTFDALAILFNAVEK